MKSVVFFASLLAACTNPPASPDAGPDAGADGGVDPLIGEWFLQVTVSDNQTARLTFAPDMTLTVVHTQDDDPASQDHAGCTETQTDHASFVEGTAGTVMTMNVTFDPSTSGQIVYTGCINPADNGTMMGYPLLSNGTWTYSIQGDTLTLTTAGASSAIDLMRQ